jgi:hypothetical protein
MGGVDVYISNFLTSALAGSEWSASCPGRFIPGTHWIGGWVGLRASLDDVEKRKFLTLPGLELRPLSRPACSQSLYRLRYPGSWNFSTLVTMWSRPSAKAVEQYLFSTVWTYGFCKHNTRGSYMCNHSFQGSFTLNSRLL